MNKDSRFRGNDKNMTTRDLIQLKRNCEVVEIPSGKKAELLEGTEVWIMQSLGGTFTVVTHQGLMYSVSGKDADVLGQEIPPELKALNPMAEKSVEEKIQALLRTCYDPEIPHNIVDLGLIYECKIEDGEGGKRVEIQMTLTAPGCGMGDWLRQDVRNKILTLPEVKECFVEVVFDPPWDRSRMHPALRRELN